MLFMFSNWFKIKLHCYPRHAIRYPVYFFSPRFRIQRLDLLKFSSKFRDSVPRSPAGALLSLDPTRDFRTLNPIDNIILRSAHDQDAEGVEGSEGKGNGAILVF